MLLIFCVLCVLPRIFGLIIVVFFLIFFSDVVFQCAINGLSVLVPFPAVRRSQFLFSYPLRPTALGCAYSSGNDTPAGLAGLFLLFLAANLRDLGFCLLPHENMVGGPDFISDLQNLDISII